MWNKLFKRKKYVLVYTEFESVTTTTYNGPIEDFPQLMEDLTEQELILAKQKYPSLTLKDEGLLIEHIEWDNYKLFSKLLTDNVKSESAPYDFICTYWAKPENAEKRGLQLGKDFVREMRNKRKNWYIYYNHTDPSYELSEKDVPDKNQVLIHKFKHFSPERAKYIYEKVMAEHWEKTGYGEKEV